MRRVYFMCFDAAVAAIILAPLFVLLYRYYFHSKRRTLLSFLFAVYLSAMFAVVGLPDIRYIRFDLHMNLIPFAYMFSDYLNSLLNVLLFLPMGFFLPILWKYFKKFHRTLLFGICTSLLIELLQIFTLRATDVNDLMTNTLGTIVGWCLARLLINLNPNIRSGWKTQEVYVVCGITLGVMVFLHPFLADYLFCFL